MSTHEPRNEPPTVPPSVYEDVERNGGLLEKWVTDEEFRAGILGADDPAEFARQHGFELQQDTSDWIKDRVAARTAEELEELLHPPRFVAF
jgi:hypothetical protein